MNYLRGTRCLICFTVLYLLFSGCTREDPEILRKEVLTNTLTKDINADSLKAYVHWLQDIGTRFCLADNHRDVAVQIKNRFRRLGYNNSRLDSFLINKAYRGINYQQWQFNVVATLEPSAASDSICVMGGHYDNILGAGDPFISVPGANDNASGVAAVLEVARVMKKNNYEPLNAIIFVAFGAEELGLYGGGSFASNAKQTSQHIKLMLNNDMIAYEPDMDNTKWSVNILDYENSHYLRKEAEQLCTKYTILGYFNNNVSNKYSDSYPFFTNGFKALFFFSARMDPNYHTLNDLVSNCNFEYCKEIVKLNCAILIDKN